MATAPTTLQSLPNTLAARCPKALAKKRVTGFLCGDYAVLTCPEPDGVRHVRVFASQLERDRVALTYHRSGCPIGQCNGGSHIILNFRSAASVQEDVHAGAAGKEG